MKEDCDVKSVKIDLVENGYLLTVVPNPDTGTKTYIAKDLEDLGYLFVKWAFTPLHKNKQKLLNELNTGE